MTSVSFQQLRHIIIQQIKPPNKSFNLKTWKLALPCFNDDVGGGLGPNMKFFYTKMWDIMFCSLSENFMYKY